MNFTKSLTKFKLNPPLRFDKWKQFMEVWADELDAQWDYIVDEKTNWNNIYEQDEEGVIRICDKFGYTTNNIALTNAQYTSGEALEYLIREAELVPYRIKYKSTYLGYDLCFKQISELGEVYNFYWANTKLVQALNWDDIFTYAGTHDFTKPFLNITADKNFSASNIKEAKLDVGNVLDDETAWTLDKDSFIVPTNHLGVTFIADTLAQKAGDTTNYSILATYLHYLKNGAWYNRKIVDTPHIGLSIATMINQNGAYDFFNEALDYTVPALELKSSVTYAFNFNYSQSFTKIYLDTSETLDDPSVWSLNNEKRTTGGTFSSDSIVYASCGSGIKEQLKTSQLSLFTTDRFIANYSFDNKLEDLTDFSISDITTTLYGTIKKVKGSLGRTVNYDGSTYVIAERVNLSNSNIGFNFWFNPNDNGEEDLVLLSIDTILEITYNASNEELNIKLNSTDNITSLDSNLHYINLNLDTNDLTLFIDSVEIATYTLSSGFTGTYDIYLGTNSSFTNYYEGTLEFLNIMIDPYSQSEIEEIYNNQLTIITSCETPLYRTELNDKEKVLNDAESILGINTWLKANTISDELGFIKEAGVETYIFNCDYQNILATSFNISIIENVSATVQETISVTDDGGGTLSGDNVSGTIDYTLGEITFNLYRDFEIINDVLFSGEVSDYISNIGNGEVETESFRLSYYISGNQYVATDNGLGVITGLFINSGTIDYITGDVNIVFDQATDDDQNGLLSYNYRKSADIDTGQQADIEYQLEENINITEIAFENEDKEALMYMTFPEMEVYDYENYIAPTMFLLM